MSKSTLIPNHEFSQLASDEQINKVVEALKANNFEVLIAENAEEAKQQVLNNVPEGAEVLVSTSRTLDALGISEAIDKSERYDAVRPRVFSLDRQTQAREIRKMRSAPDIVLGSVHAVTEEGQILIATQSGSQVASYAFGAGRVIWVIGTHKLVHDLNEGMRRIQEYSVPLEDARALEVYGVNTSLNKILIVSKESFPGRTTIVLLKEQLGF